MINEVRLDKSVQYWGKGLLLRRFLWEAVRMFLWPNHFRFLSPVRIFFLKLFGADVSTPCLVMDRVRVWMPWNLTMGAYSTLGSNVEVYNFGKVTIGSHTVISQRSYLCTATHEYGHSAMPLKWKPIEIGSGVWIAAEVFVAPGVTVGDGAVVGARSVVTKNIPEWMVCAGHPAKAIKRRELKSDN